jgi:UDP:flavonoid glycosyltransferase YjiC (YdhE family)
LLANARRNRRPPPPPLQLHKGFIYASTHLHDVDGRDKIYDGDTPVDIVSAAAQCDAAICHSGIGTVNALLQAVKPMVLLPAQLEQFLLARNVEALGAAIVVVPEEVKQEFGGALKAILENPSFSGKTRAFAERYREPSIQAVVDRAVARIEGRALEATA